LSGTITFNGKSINLAEAVPAVSIVTEATADSHTFNRTESPALPAGQTMQDVVDALNVNKAAAHGTFEVVPVGELDSWKITCDAGYEWLDDQDPGWGVTRNGLEPRTTARIAWDRDNLSWAEVEDNTGGTDNGANFGKIFNAGCWQE
jgi:hypothetical protein